MESVEKMLAACKGTSISQAAKAKAHKRSRLLRVLCLTLERLLKIELRSAALRCLPEQRSHIYLSLSGGHQAQRAY